MEVFDDPHADHRDVQSVLSNVLPETRQKYNYPTLHAPNNDEIELATAIIAQKLYWQ